MRLRYKLMIIFGSIILLALVITIIAVVRYNKYNVPHSYNNVISTKNISHIEYRLYEEGPLEYDKEDYRTLTDEEESTFISSINDDNLKYKYWGSPSRYKGMRYNTFIIHYENGSTTYFDRCSVRKFDSNNKETYYKILLAYECKIGLNLFKPGEEEDSDYYTVNKRVVNQFNEERSSYPYWTEVDLQSKIRYYKTINGYITNDYYDIVYKDGKINYISKSIESISNQDVKPIVYNYDSTGDEDIIIKEKIIVYYIIDDSIVPIIMRTLHIMGIQNSYRINYDCYNMFTGEEFNYAVIRQLIYGP